MGLNYRSLFLSDIHMGSKGCKDYALINLLENIEHVDYIYLLGDIIDCWRLRKGTYWPKSHTKLIRNLINLGENGTKLVYIPGNHDMFIKQFFRHSQVLLGSISIEWDHMHTTADGKKFYLLHGDRYDFITKNYRWLSVLAGWSYDLLISFNNKANKIRHLFGKSSWSFSSNIKNKVKETAVYISRFHDLIKEDAKKRKVDGVICGHTHYPMDENYGSFRILNTGDFVENCSYIVEHLDGTLEVKLCQGF